jgi:hypothetical protein
MEIVVTEQTATPTDNDFFVRHFQDRADLAEELHGRGFTVDARIIASTALDALGEVWFRDFPDDAQAIAKEVGGAVPPSIRMARLVKRFAAGAPQVDKVAVVLFAEDWKKNVPRSTVDADALLEPRRPKLPGELPHSYLDVSKDELLRECQPISSAPALVALVEEYEFPALLYRFVRSPTVHSGTSSNRTHGFAQRDEVFYMPLAHGTTIGISLGVVTGWLRAAVMAYVSHCAGLGVRPATAVNAGRQGEDALKAKWKRVADPSATEP